MFVGATRELLTAPLQTMPRADKQRAAPPKQGAAPYAKPHACPDCAAAFGQAGNLTQHVRLVHEKRKDYACPYCAGVFQMTSHLTRHVRTVHEKRRDHACPHCAAAFGEAGNLNKHVRTQHPGSDSSQPSVL